MKQKVCQYLLQLHRKLADISLRCGDLPQYGGGLLIAEALALCYKDVAGLLDCSKRYRPALALTESQPFSKGYQKSLAQIIF